MLKLNKVNDTLYTLTQDILEDKVIKVLEEISYVDYSDFNTEINETLEDSIVSRIVASHFIKENPSYFNTNNMYVKIIVPFKGRSVEVTVGTIVIDKKEQIVNGVLYK